MTTRKKASELMQDNTPSPSAPGPLAKVIQLPLWPEDSRGVPNGVLRSALFGAIRKGPRRYLERERIASLEGVEIRYTGQRLDQGDLDVWEAVLHIARQQAMGKECRFTAYAMLKMLGLSNTGPNREIMHKRLLRLRANAVEIRQGRFTYMGGLVDEAYKDEETLEYVVVLNPKLRALFERDHWTATDWAVRLDLAGHPLAQWLHGFYATHANPYPLSVAKLHELCGSEAKLLSDFKKDLRRALESLEQVSARHNLMFRTEIRGELVHVEKTPSASQQRHLAMKKSTKPHWDKS